VLLGEDLVSMASADPPGNVNHARDNLRGTHRPIRNDNLGDAFYDFLPAARTPLRDPFRGLGNTLIAFEKSGRAVRRMALDPRYVDVIVRRWRDCIGKAATRQGDGVAFDNLAGRGRRPTKQSRGTSILASDTTMSLAQVAHDTACAAYGPASGFKNARMPGSWRTKA
jgi:hypothetical protein